MSSSQKYNFENTQKIEISKIVSWGKKTYKYLIGYKDDDDHRVTPLRIMLPKTNAWVNCK